MCASRITVSPKVVLGAAAAAAAAPARAKVAPSVAAALQPGFVPKSSCTTATTAYPFCDDPLPVLLRLPATTTTPPAATTTTTTATTASTTSSTCFVGPFSVLVVSLQSVVQSWRLPGRQGGEDPKGGGWSRAAVWCDSAGYV